MSVIGIASDVKSGERTAESVARDALNRIEKREGDIQAWQYLDTDKAIENATALDREGAKGPMAGVPVGIKDIIDTADMPTENGVATDRGRQPEGDATVVARLRQAGALIIGKTVTTECAYFSPGKSRNPHDPTRTPGGSSSGSGAAVGSGAVPLALGTQTVASVLRPASYCGTWGMKPTYGLIPRTGVLLISRTLDHVGVLAQSPTDMARAIDTLSGDDGVDPASAGVQATRLEAGLEPPLGKPRLAFLRDQSWSEVDIDAVDLMEEAADKLGAESIAMPEELGGIGDVQRTILAAEMAHFLWPRYAAGGEMMSERLRAQIVAGRSVGADRYLEAIGALEKMRSALPDLLKGFDAAIMPTASGEAPVVEPEPPSPFPTGNPNMCLLWTALGVPAVTVPVLKGPNGMPIGIQVVGLRGSDIGTLRAAAWIGREYGIA